MPPTDFAPPRAAIDADGFVEGYASLFGAVDQANDMVMPGAFAQTLRARDIRRIPMLFQHDPAEPIGIWLELTEDWLGLRVRGRLIPEVVRARELYALLREGAADGLSIGFRTVRARIDPKTRIRRLTELDLWEISLVTFPLLAGARVRAVKERRLPYAVSMPRTDDPERLLRRQPRLSVARTRAETEWRTVAGTSAVGGRVGTTAKRLGRAR
jgi:HK97 family phage prohead protease